MCVYSCEVKVELAVQCAGVADLNNTPVYRLRLALQAQSGKVGVGIVSQRQRSLKMHKWGICLDLAAAASLTWSAVVIIDTKSIVIDRDRTSQKELAR